MKLLIKIAVVVTLLFLTIDVSFNFWLRNRLEKAIDHDTYYSLLHDIKTSKDLPPRFYKIHGIVFGNEKLRFNKHIPIPFRMFLIRSYCCPCYYSHFPLVTKTLDRWLLTLALDNDSSPQKCFDYNMNKTFYANDIIGVEKAAKSFYNKTLNNLSNKEILELIIISKNPIYFQRYPDRLVEKTKGLLPKLQSIED